MRILETVKYYEPSKGGMESVVKSIVEGVTYLDSSVNFFIYSNHNFVNSQFEQNTYGNITVIKESTPIIFKSQPLQLSYPYLKNNLDKFDLIHHHYPFPNMEINFLRFKEIIKKRKLIITWHANINNSRWALFEKFYNPFTIKLLNLADKIILTSDQLLYESNILNNFEKKLDVIPLSFDPIFENNSLVSKSYNFKEKFKILFVGKLRKYKGIDILIDSIKDLDVYLTIIGDGEEKDNLLSQVASHNISHKVNFLSDCDNLNLIDAYRSANIFVLPSINEAEAFGVVQLEAMANGLPVINTRLNSGVPFVSLDSKTGFTVDPQNIPQLRNAILKLMNDPDLYMEYSKNSILRSKIFSRDTMAKKYHKIFQTI
jgi:glycosyltransferase involved in cell wall biosynthesis